MLANLPPEEQRTLIGESSDLDSCLEQLSTDREVDLTGLIGFVQTYRLNLLVAKAMSSEINELGKLHLHSIPEKHVQASQLFCLIFTTLIILECPI